MEEALYGALAVVIFRVVLNGYLNGAKKLQIDAVLGALSLGLLAFAFVALSWQTGLKAIALCIIAAGVMRPFARATARFLYAHPPKD